MRIDGVPAHSFLARLAHRLASPRVTLLSFSIVNVVFVVENFYLQIGCRVPLECGQDFLRRFVYMASAFPIFLVTDMLFDRVLIDHVSQPKVLVAIAIGTLGGVLNCVASGWLFRWLASRLIRRIKAQEVGALASLVAVVWVASALVLGVSLSSVYLGPAILSAGGILVYTAIRMIEVLTGFARYWLHRKRL